MKYMCKAKSRRHDVGQREFNFFTDFECKYIDDIQLPANWSLFSIKFSLLKVVLCIRFNLFLLLLHVDK